MGLFFIACTVVFTIGEVLYKKEKSYAKIVETLISYILLFNVGIMSLFAAYGHVFMGPEIAKLIGWQSGSPFQYEIGMANLSYGVLGVLSFWIRGRFWEAVIIGWAILFVGCFVGHVINFYSYHNYAPYNIGPYIWFYDLILPVVTLALFATLRFVKKLK